MGIRLKLIEKNKKRSYNSPFANSDCFTYDCSPVYLGAEGKTVTIDGRFEFRMSFSAMDGILVKIKQNRPYKVLFLRKFF